MYLPKDTQEGPGEIVQSGIVDWPCRGPSLVNQMPVIPAPERLNTSDVFRHENSQAHAHTRTHAHTRVTENTINLKNKRQPGREIKHF